MADKQGASISKTVDSVELMFEKADNEINYLTRKLTFELEYGQDDKPKTNPVRLMTKVDEVKKEFKSLTQELQQIQQTQKETVDHLRSQLLNMTEMLQRLEMQTGTTPELSEEDEQKFEQLAQLMGVSKEVLLPPPSDSSAAHTSAQQPEALPPPSSSSSSASGGGSAAASSTDACEPSLDNEKDKGFHLSPVERRVDTTEFIPLTKEEFMSVSNLIRLRAKLDDVNKTYRLLWQHFKEEGNTEALSPGDMNAKGMRVTGATGEAKLKTLRALKLCQISRTGSVSLS